MTIERSGTANQIELPRPSSPERQLGTFRRLWAMRSDPLSSLGANAYKDLRVTSRLLGRDYLMLNDPDDIDHVLNTHRDRYERNVLARRILEPATGDGLLLAEGEAWQQQRRSLVPAFQPRHIERLIPTFHDVVFRRLSRWENGRATEHNLHTDFRELALAIAGRLMFSISDEGKIGELADLVVQGERSSALIDWRDYVAWLIWEGMPQSAKRRSLRAEWRRWAEQRLDEHKPSSSLDQARDVLDLLRAAHDGGAGMDRATIVDQIDTMMAAGFVTTASALFWTALMLSVMPEQQDVIRAELCQEDTHEPPAGPALRAARKTTAFVYETLRLYPPAYAISRVARAEDRLGDLRVRRGTTVTIWPWFLHRHDRHWRDPHHFDPGRFLRDGRIVMPKAWMPFGTGPRVCIGATFALTEILVVLRVLLARFRLEIRGPLPRPVGRVTLAPSFMPSVALIPIVRTGESGRAHA
ncbi:MAG: cytochrome P450 [Alphaproteobacteria bacterium]